MKKYVRCVETKAGTSMHSGAVYEVLAENVGDGGIYTKVRVAGGGSSGSLRNTRFAAWVPTVGDEVRGPGAIVRVIAEIDFKMFSTSCTKVGMRLLSVADNSQEWLTAPGPGELPCGVEPFLCMPPRQLNPQASDGREVRDLSHLDKTLGELLAEDSRRKALIANEMAATGPKLKPPVIGPEKDPAFLRDEEALGKRKLTIKAWKEQISRARNAIKEAHAELVKLIGKEEADAV